MQSKKARFILTMVIRLSDTLTEFMIDHEKRDGLWITQTGTAKYPILSRSYRRTVQTLLISIPSSFFFWVKMHTNHVYNPSNFYILDVSFELYIFVKTEKKREREEKKKVY